MYKVKDRKNVKPNLLRKIFTLTVIDSVISIKKTNPN